VITWENIPVAVTQETQMRDAHKRPEKGNWIPEHSLCTHFCFLTASLKSLFNTVVVQGRNEGNLRTDRAACFPDGDAELFSRQTPRVQEESLRRKRSFRTAVAFIGSGFTFPEEEMHFLGQYNGCEE